CDVTASGNGRHAYMAPEQLSSEPIDRRVDVYAMGLVLFEMLTGRALFSGPIFERRRSEIEVPSRERPELPRLVDGIIRRELAFEISTILKLHDGPPKWRVWPLVLGVILFVGTAVPIALWPGPPMPVETPVVAAPPPRVTPARPPEKPLLHKRVKTKKR